MTKHIYKRYLIRTYYIAQGTLIQYFVMANMGKELIHFAIHLKLIQYCKSTLKIVLKVLVAQSCPVLCEPRGFVTP